MEIKNTGGWKTCSRGHKYRGPGPCPSCWPRGRKGSKHLAIIFAASVFSAAAANGPFEGRNCRMAGPPASAGEDATQGLIVKIHPRKREIARMYTGCQTTWIAVDEKRWKVLGMTRFENGDAVSFWSPPPYEEICQYQSGKLVAGKRDMCPAHESLRVKSMPRGCAVKKMRGAGDPGKGCKLD